LKYDIYALDIAKAKKIEKRSDTMLNGAVSHYGQLFPVAGRPKTYYPKYQPFS